MEGGHGFAAEQLVDEEQYLCRIPEELRNPGGALRAVQLAEKGLRQLVALQGRRTDRPQGPGGLPRYSRSPLLAEAPSKDKQRRRIR
jgi:hypothetical protein